MHKTIELQSEEDLLEQARKLDKMQKYVLSLGLQYAKDLIKTESGKNKIPSAPLIMVHGGAGSGKSSLIHTLAPMMVRILQKPKDDPECPYVVLTAHFGSAAANINGSTLHHTFGFKFGTKFVSLSDKQRDEKRYRFRNLKCVIIDEISLVSSDLLYNLDLKLREIMMVPNKVMGGVAVFAFGDLFQLQPVQGRYVFEKPHEKDHALACELRNLWHLFTIINLEENHRQEDDKSYADLLNRVRIGRFTDEDIESLRTRVKKEDSKEIKNYTNDLHIYGTNKKVNARNKLKLEEMKGRLYTIKAGNNSRMLKAFKPKVDNAGCVYNTPLQAVLKLKIGIEVILVWNIDVADGLANGSRGVLVGVEMAKTDNNEETIKRLIVKFHNKKHGEEKRGWLPCKRYPEATYIEPYTHQYHIHSSIATCQQFPLKAAAGMTSHKIQGQTVTKPNSLVIDMRDTFTAGMVYVMLSRVCNIDQLHIIEEVNPAKIKASAKVCLENKRMESISVNNNPTPWNNKAVKGTRISSLNVSSLKRHIEDVRSDHSLLMSDIICLSETWLEEEMCNHAKYQLDGYKSFFNCQKRGNEKGKGLATYIKGNNWKWETEVKTLFLHVTKLTSDKIDVINVYRSSDHPFTETIKQLQQLINLKKNTLIIGDFNYCSKTSQNKLQIYLIKIGFQQLITTATHIGGNVLDQAHLRTVGEEVPTVVESITEYYSDHDLITVLIPSGRHQCEHHLIFKHFFNLK